MVWLRRILLFLNNRVAEPIHAHIRKVLDVPSNRELAASEARLYRAQSTFLEHVVSAEKMLLGREEAIHRLMTQVEGKLHDLELMDARIIRREESAARIQSGMEEAASRTTLAIYDIVEQLIQAQDLLRKVKAYEEKKVKEQANE